MSQPTPWEPREAMDQRASHEDREQVADVLRIAAGDGRLSLEELDDRLEACYAARTYGDLAGLVTDLPGQPPVSPPAPVPAKELMRVKRVGGSVRYQGAWVVPRRLELEVRGGSVVLDFTTAKVAGPVTELDVRLRGGSLRLTVPPGYAVDADEVSIRGGSVRRRGEPPQPDAPVVHRIVVTGELAGGSVVVVPPKQPGGPGRRRWFFRRR